MPASGRMPRESAQSGDATAAPIPTNEGLRREVHGSPRTLFYEALKPYVNSSNDAEAVTCT